MKIIASILILFSAIAYNASGQNSELLLRYLNDKSIATIDENSNYNIMVFMCRNCGNCGKKFPGFLEKLSQKKDKWLFIFDSSTAGFNSTDFDGKAIIIEANSADLVRYNLFHAHHLYFEITKGVVTKSQLASKNEFKAFLKTLK